MKDKKPKFNIGDTVYAKDTINCIDGNIEKGEQLIVTDKDIFGYEIENPTTKQWMAEVAAEQLTEDEPIR